MLSYPSRSIKQKSNFRPLCRKQRTTDDEDDGSYDDDDDKDDEDDDDDDDKDDDDQDKNDDENGDEINGINDLKGIDYNGRKKYINGSNNVGNDHNKNTIQQHQKGDDHGGKKDKGNK